MNPLTVLQARAEARAVLYQLGEINDLDDALRPLFDYAQVSGLADEIGADAMFAIVQNAFKGIAEI